jgi:hypothetical protein
MHDFDPRWPDDPRDDEYDRDLSRGSRGGSDDRDSARDLEVRSSFWNSSVGDCRMAATPTSRSESNGRPASKVMAQATTSSHSIPGADRD